MLVSDLRCNGLLPEVLLAHVRVDDDHVFERTVRKFGFLELCYLRGEEALGMRWRLGHSGVFRTLIALPGQLYHLTRSVVDLGSHRCDCRTVIPWRLNAVLLRVEGRVLRSIVHQTS